MRKLEYMIELETKVEIVFREALDIFLEKERENIINDIAERSLCGRLSHYMEGLLSENNLGDYFSDTEYNRKQNGEIKTILDGELRVVPIQCDIIVHSRGGKIQHDNLIAIEMKKSSRPRPEKDNDRDRLRALTKASYDDIWSNDGQTHPEHVCGYVLGVYMEIDSKQNICLIEHYKKGQKISEFSMNF